MNEIILFLAGFLAGGRFIEIRIEKKASGRNDLSVKPATKLIKKK